MNTFLKAVIKEAFDAEAIVADVVAKAWSKLVGDAIAAGTDASAIVASIGSAKTELEALLTNPAADADLLAYVTTLAGGVNEKAQKIIAAASKLTLDNITGIEALVAAIKA